jgi:hypothetical protein
VSDDRPWVLNPYCGVGGTTRGLQMAGFRVFGVDIAEQGEYCGDDFHQGDAVGFIQKHGHKFPAICAEPPCQNQIAITAGNRARPGWTDTHRNWIAPTRVALAEVRAQTGIPTVIECGVGRHLRRDLMLCGDMFYREDYTGPRIQRHRWFEAEGVEVPQPKHPKHLGYVRGWRHGEYRDGRIPSGGVYVAVYGKGGGKADVTEARQAMGIDWTHDWEALTEAIPPMYSEYVGHSLMAAVRARAGISVS